MIAMLMALLSLCAESPTAAAQPAPAAPRLQLVAATGALRVRPPDALPYPLAASVEAGLPYIEPGSEITVVSGEAILESDNRATIRAKAGASFLFAPASPEGGPSGAFRIQSLAAEPSTEVDVGGASFLLHHGGGVTVASTAPGIDEVKVDAAGVELASSLLRAGETFTFSAVQAPGVGMTPGDSLSLKVPLQSGFASEPVGRLSLRTSEIEVASAEEGAARRPAFAADAPSARQRAEDEIASWPEACRLAAEAMLEKYGPPQEVGDGRLVWINNGPWKRTAVFRDEAQPLKQTVAYEAASRHAGQVTAFNAGVGLDSELSSRSDSEKTNILALNLADEIMRGEKSVEQARRFYDRTMSLSFAGKSSPYMERLLFMAGKKQHRPKRHRRTP